MKCKNCGQEKDTHNDRNPWNDCKQFIPSEDVSVPQKVVQNKGCGKPYKKGILTFECGIDKLCPSCSALKQGAEVIKKAAEKHSKDVDDDIYNTLTETDKDPEGKDDRCHLQEHSSGSDIPLSDKIFGEFK